MKRSDIDGHRVILFCVDHLTPLGILRSLGEGGGIYPIIVLVAEKSRLIRHSRYVGQCHQVSSIEEGYNLIIELFGKDETKPFIFAGSDKIVECLEKHYDEIADRFVFYNAGQKGRLLKFQQKDVICDAARKVGLQIPRGETVDTGVLPKTLNYPIITKVLASTMGAWKGDVYVCENEEELKEAYTKIKSPKLLLQEYIKKKGEFCMEGFAVNHGKEIFMPLVCNYLRLSSTSYGYYMEFSPFEDQNLRHKIETLFEQIGFEGIFEIEFMRGPKDETYFLEINFRPSMWVYALTSVGGNLPYYWAKSMLKGHIVFEEMNFDNRLFRAICELPDFVENVKTVGLSRWLHEFTGSRVKYLWNKKDKRPFFHYLWYRIKHRIGRTVFKKDIA